MKKTAAFLLQMKGIEKSFPGVRALSSVSFDLREGEIHALVGENGAGKSTLLKILSGAQLADAGEIVLRGFPVSFRSPLEARAAGIATVYQEFTLIPFLPVYANLFLGQEHSRKGFVDARSEKREAKAIFEKLGVAIDVEARVADLRVAEQQLVEIGRAFVQEAKVLVLDEPTAALSPRESERLFQILRELKSREIGIIFVSHRLEEVFSIADRITVLRDGFSVDNRPVSNYSRSELIEQMVGRSMEIEARQREAQPGDVRLEVRRLSGGKVKEVSFSVKSGEVAGLAGLMGSGRTETVRLIFGADRKSGGEILLDGRVIKIDSPRDAIRQGICLLTEDRKTEGLVLKASARENFSLPNLPRGSRLGWIDTSRERHRFLEQVKNLKMRIFSPEQRAETLSGGNQQKLLMARWLETDASVFIFDEPTRGIDVGAKQEIFFLISELAARGKAVLVISSELPELLGICDRILVMRKGRIAGEIAEAKKVTAEEIMSLAV